MRGGAVADGPATDRRMTPANGRVAHVALQGRIAADRYVTGTPARVAVPLADLRMRPDGPRDRQVILGDRLLVLDRVGGHAFVQAEKDGFCGYLAEATLGPDAGVTHWVSAPASHLYTEADLKRPESAALTMGAKLRILAEVGRFSQTDGGAFVPTCHLAPVGTWLSDPATIAETFLGTPYLWGGNSRSGIDCSGLMQAALLACGLPCPGDSDLQMATVGTPLPQGAPIRRNDLLFWKGHVAMALDADRMIHANGHRMAVTREAIAEAITRIAAQGEGPLLAIRRP